MISGLKTACLFCHSLVQRVEGSFCTAAAPASAAAMAAAAAPVALCSMRRETNLYSFADAMVVDVIVE